MLFLLLLVQFAPLRGGGTKKLYHAITDLVASQLTDGHLQFFDIDHGTCKFISLQQDRGACDPHCTAGGPNLCSTAAEKRYTMANVIWFCIELAEPPISTAAKFMKLLDELSGARNFLSRRFRTCG